MDITNQKINSYAQAHSTAGEAVLLEIEQYLADNKNLPPMHSGSLQAQFLKMLVQTTGAKKILEIGTYLGYATIAMASGLPSDGEIITLEKDATVAQKAQEFFAKSKAREKITLIFGDAKDNIEKLNDVFDLVFIDADKKNYPVYFSAVFEKVKSGGLIVIDNTLWKGQVLKPKEATEKVIDELNKDLVNNGRVEVVLLPIRDGITLVYKK